MTLIISSMKHEASILLLPPNVKLLTSRLMLLFVKHAYIYTELLTPNMMHLTK